MSLGSVMAFLAVLLVVFIVGTVWFHLVESLLARLRQLFGRHREPPAWHPLPREEDPDR